jgi:hypothetical protein
MGCLAEFRAELGTTVARQFENCPLRLTQGSSWILEIASSVVPAKVQRDGLCFSPAEDTLKRRVT